MVLRPPWARCLLLAVVAVAMGGVFGIVSVSLIGLPERVFAGVIGGLIGSLTAPIVVATLWPKHLGVALAVVYVPSLVVVVIEANLDRPIIYSVPTVLVLSIVVGFLLPRAWNRHPAGHCQGCGYDLRGNVSGVCPECGRQIRPLRSR